MADFNQYCSNVYCSIDLFVPYFDRLLFCLCYVKKVQEQSRSVLLYLWQFYNQRQATNYHFRYQKDVQVVLWLPIRRPRQTVGITSNIYSLFYWFTQTNVIDAFCYSHDMARTKRPHSGLLFLPCQCKRVFFKN